jgi:hypothetical protein
MGELRPFRLVETPKLPLLGKRAWVEGLYDGLFRPGLTSLYDNPINQRAYERGKAEGQALSGGDEPQPKFSVGLTVESPYPKSRPLTSEEQSSGIIGGEQDG